MKVLDGSIESSFKESFAYKTYLKDDHIRISAKDGAVILSGDVINKSHKPIAQHMAEALPGVKSVDDRIVITGDHPAENSDNWIGMKVKAELLFHSNVSGLKTEVNVKDGMVTLKGEASSQAQKELTTEYAKDIVGVKGVINELKVVTASQKQSETVGELIDDASITAQVKTTLMLHRSTGALRTTVTTTDGVVTLGGIAKNAAERGLASKVVADIHGVRSVIDNMTIEESKN
ncbi:MAG: BON domain-containing protein [Chlorobiales bacterium]|jgi:hyperosmotically inducible periplasmic protein|nr:BON domain-containing protein [Chlorobiales bacterium]